MNRHSIEPAIQVCPNGNLMEETAHLYGSAPDNSYLKWKDLEDRLHNHPDCTISPHQDRSDLLTVSLIGSDDYQVTCDLSPADFNLRLFYDCYYPYWFNDVNQNNKRLLKFAPTANSISGATNIRSEHPLIPSEIVLQEAFGAIINRKTVFYDLGKREIVALIHPVDVNFTYLSLEQQKIARRNHHSCLIVPLEELHHHSGHHSHLVPHLMAINEGPQEIQGILINTEDYKRYKTSRQRPN